MTRPYRGRPISSAPVVGAVHRAALTKTGRQGGAMHRPYGGCTISAAAIVGEAFQASRSRRTTSPEGPMHRSYRPEIVTVKEWIDPFPTGMFDDLRTQGSPFEKGELSAEQAD